jgi:hypothetical protein
MHKHASKTFLFWRRAHLDQNRIVAIATMHSVLQTGNPGPAPQHYQPAGQSIGSSVVAIVDLKAIRSGTATELYQVSCV